MTTDVTDESRRLFALSDEDFLDELNQNLGNWRQFAPFATGINSARTREALEDMAAKTDGDLIKYEFDVSSDPGWVLRAKGFKRIVQRCVAQLDRADEGRLRNHTSQLRAWRAYAHELCEALDLSNACDALDRIKPPFGEMTAGEWMERRLEKRGLLAEVAEEVAA